jgi:hypothetical protein
MLGPVRSDATGKLSYAHDWLVGHGHTQNFHGVPGVLGVTKCRCDAVTDLLHEL